MPKGKPLSAAHKAKIAAGVRAYHRGCAPKAKAKAKSKKPAKPPAKPKKLTAGEKADDAWHARNKDTSGQAQANRVNSVADRIARQAAIRKDMARVRRIRGR